MTKKKRERTKAEYVRLCEAVIVLADWAPEIEEELSKHGYGESYLREVIDAAYRVRNRDQ